MNIEIKRKYLYDFFKPVSVVTEECLLKLDKESMKVSEVDASHVIMIESELSKNTFETFEVKDEYEIGLNLNKFLKFLKHGSKNEVVNIELIEEENKLYVELTDELMELDLPLIDTAGMTEPNVPDLDLPYEFEIEKSGFRKIVRACKSITDHLEVSIEQDVEGKSIRISASEDIDRVSKRFDTEYTFKGSGDDTGSRSMFAVEYFDSMSKKMPDTKITMELGEHYPIKMHWDFSDGEGKSTYLVAPRIESE